MNKKLKPDDGILGFSFFIFYGRYFYKFFEEIVILWYNLNSMTISPHFVIPQQMNGMLKNEMLKRNERMKNNRSFFYQRRGILLWTVR